jgi:regulator of sigma E protease
MIWVTVIVGLTLLVILHELGHFGVALLVGMKPRSFYIGFPPAIAKRQRNGVEYGLGAIPLGGYVKIPGMHRPAPSDLDVYFGAALYDEPRLLPAIERVKRPLADGDFQEARDALDRLEEALAQADLSRAATGAARRGVAELRDGLGADAYWRQRTWKRLAVIAAGPATNLVFAVLLLAVVYMIGIPSAASRRVESVQQNSPAAKAGLRAGDTIMAVNRIPTPTFADVRHAIETSGGHPLALYLIHANGQIKELPAVKPDRVGGRYILGFTPTVVRYKHYGPVQAIGLAGRDVGYVTKAMGNWLIHISSSQSRKQISTPVGIVRTSSEAAHQGYRDYFAILALINLSLALLNLLPLLPLDGEHMAFSLIEGLRGHTVDRVVYERVSMVGIALILFIYVIGLSNDVGRLTGG